MDALLAQPHEHLVQMLTRFAASVRSSRPAGQAGKRWSRVAAHLEQELRQLRALAVPSRAPAGGESAKPGDAASADTALRGSAARLTQLARTQDGLRFEQSAGAPAEQLLDERRLVVFAAWQLSQALDQVASPAAGSR